MADATHKDPRHVDGTDRKTPISPAPIPAGQDTARWPATESAKPVTGRAGGPIHESRPVLDAYGAGTELSAALGCYARLLNAAPGTQYLLPEPQMTAEH